MEGDLAKRKGCCSVEASRGSMNTKRRGFKQHWTVLHHLAAQRWRENLFQEHGPASNWFPLEEYKHRHLSTDVPGVTRCLEHTGEVTQLICKARESRGDLVALWLDLTNACGSIPHKLVETVLTRHHVPEMIRNDPEMICALYTIILYTYCNASYCSSIFTLTVAHCTCILQYIVKTLYTDTYYITQTHLYMCIYICMTWIQ